jgi:arsenical pump membrane protein
MTLIIGNPTNIYLASSAGIDFLEYLKIMILPSMVCAVGAFFLLLAIFHKQLREPMLLDDAPVQLGNKFLLITGIVHLVVAIIALSVCSYINIEMYIPCAVIAGSLMIFAFVYLLVKKQGLSLFLRVFKRLPYALAPFVLSMFVIVLALNKCGFTEMVAKAFNNGDSIFIYGLTSFLSANVLNNIPMSVLFADGLSLAGLVGVDYYGALYASIIGSNIGAYLTPVGALAGIMWLSILKKHDYPLSFAKFMTYGVMISIPLMILALATLHLSILFI